MDAIKTPDTTDVETDADLKPATFDEQIHFCTPAEWWAIIDREARSLLGMSTDDFVRKWNAGEFHDPDPDPHPGVMSVAMLLPIDW